MATIDVPAVNGVYWAYADIICKCGPGQFLGFTSINYTDKLGRQYVRGTHREPLGMTSGQYEAGGDFELYLPQADTFRQFLVAQGGGNAGYMQVPFDMSVSYAPAPEYVPTQPGTALQLITDIVYGCRITEDEASQSEGLDALKRKFTFMCQRIVKNGAFAVSPPLTGFGVVG